MLLARLAYLRRKGRGHLCSQHYTLLRIQDAMLICQVVHAVRSDSGSPEGVQRFLAVVISRSDVSNLQCGARATVMLPWLQ